MVFTGLGCDTSAVIKLLADPDATQRAYTQEAYKKHIPGTLLKELSGKLKVLNTYINFVWYGLHSTS